MPKTYEPITTQTVGTAVATISFTSIPQNYTDLVIVSTVRISGTGGEGATVQFNGDTATNYSWSRLFANTVITSDRASNTSTPLFGYYPGNDSTSGLFGNSIAQINNYSNTTTNKIMLQRWNNNQTGGVPHVGLNAVLYRSTSAITSMLITAQASKTFIAGCTFTLYGIRAA
jgi:hypothetical protein